MFLTRKVSAIFLFFTSYYDTIDIQQLRPPTIFAQDQIPHSSPTNQAVRPPVMWLMCVVYFHMITWLLVTLQPDEVIWSHTHTHVQITVELEYTMVQQLEYKSVF